MAIPWIESNQALPYADQAESNGLVAAGLDLSPDRLFEAYSKGLFPWFSPGDPVLWWSPNPRMVLQCADLHISKSLARKIKQFNRPQLDDNKDLIVTTNLAFQDVITACATRHQQRLSLGLAKHGQQYIDSPIGTGRNSTWITPEINLVYSAWHRLGYVHSIEVWINNQLAGGLYGVNIGHCFFGESMFSRVTDSSKIALVYLVAYLGSHNIDWIDCQQETPHLASLGAKPISRGEFLAILSANIVKEQPVWGRGRLRANGELES